MPSGKHPVWQCVLVASVLVFSAGASCAAGLNATGVVGGLSIPTAHALGDGAVALAWGSVREAQITGPVARNVSHALGIGLAPGLDLVGRFTENATRNFNLQGFNITRGISDLSANAKASMALGHGDEAPRVAIGMNDLSGGALNFKATYGVATLPMGPLELNLGVGHSQGRMRVDAHRTVDGLFGGVSYALMDSALRGGVSLAAEHDGRQPLLGMRWISAPLRSLGRSQLSFALHRTVERGSVPGETVATLGWLMPFGENQRRLAQFEPVAPRPMPPSTEAQVSTHARLGTLRGALINVGLEQVRVGVAARGDWVIEVENVRYGQSELDAMGVALGLAVEAAPKSTKRVQVVVLKTGVPVLTVDVDAEAWRGFLRVGYAGSARGSMRVARGRLAGSGQVDWLEDVPRGATWARIRVRPVLRNTLGTEFGAFDYAIGPRVDIALPLWRGARVVGTWHESWLHSRNVAPDKPFAALLRPEGWRSIVLHQTLAWNPHFLIGLGLGRYEERALGVEGETLAFVPGRDDIVRLRGRWLDQTLFGPYTSPWHGGASYRWAVSDSLWVEPGWQRYLDGLAGPSLTVTRWWGDIGVHLNLRKGDQAKFAGLELSFPLTPRRAPAAAGVLLEGAPRWRYGLRTRITDANEARNLITPGSVVDYDPVTSIYDAILDAGRLGPRHVEWQLDRMRVAFHTFVAADAP